MSNELLAEHLAHGAQVDAVGGLFHFFLNEILDVLKGLVDRGTGEVGQELRVGEGGGGVVGEGDDFEVAVGDGGDEGSAGSAGGGDGGESGLDGLDFGLHVAGLGHHGSELGEHFELVEHGTSQERIGGHCRDDRGANTGWEEIFVGVKLRA